MEKALVKQKVVGTYELGSEMVQLVLREGDGGEFYFLPGDQPCPRIKIGADYKLWADVVHVLLHESFEFCAARLACRWWQSDLDTQDHSQYLFALDHRQFDECCCRTAGFLTRALPDLATAWKKWKRKQ